jgi:hypothetical protein
MKHVSPVLVVISVVMVIIAGVVVDRFAWNSCARSMFQLVLDMSEQADQLKYRVQRVQPYLPALS